jgi:hypothetical protein
MAKRVFRRRRNRLFSDFRGSAAWPVVMTLLALCGLFLAYLFVSNVAIPFVSRLFRDDRRVVMPTATPEQVGDASGRIREVLLTNPFKHISYPVLLGNDIYFASGSDNAQNPKLDKIFMTQTYTSSAITPKEIAGIVAECGYILHLDVSANYIVYFDGYRTGGGLLKVLNRTSGQVKTLYTVDYGVVLPKLSGRKCVFLQRISDKQEKLYSMDIETGEVTTLHVYNDSPLGKYQAGVCDKNVVFAVENPKMADSERYNLIKIVAFDGQTRTYDPGMFAYAPVTNGTAIAFTDSPRQSGALYLSINGAMHKKISDKASGYGLADNFLAWCEGGRIFAHFWEQNKTVRVSSLGEYAMLASVSKHGITWFDITAEKRERDILKYTVLD